MAEISRKEDLDKPTAEVRPAGLTAEQEAATWQEAAFREARRANKYRDELTAVRDRINQTLKDDPAH